MKGFTLVEMVIVIAIMTILTAVILTALPKARGDQLLKSDIIQLHTLLAAAAQRSLNEIRTPECLTIAGEDETLQRRCSDIGVAVVETRRILFADLDGDKQYSVSGDFDIETENAASSPADEMPFSVVFAAVPPTVTTYANGDIVGAGQVVPLTLAADNTSRDLTIGPYGIVEDVPPE